MTEAVLANRLIFTPTVPCSGNPGPGGWGCILEFGPHRKEMSGYMAGTTNNRMELFAAISALGALKEPCDVKLYSDSAYLVNAFNEHWIDGWRSAAGRMPPVKRLRIRISGSFCWRRPRSTM